MKKTELLLFIIFFILFAIFTKAEAISWGDASRMATIESLVEKGTFIIDNSTFNWTKDKVFIRGHFYSGFAPLLPYLSSSIYFILNKVFRLSFLTHNNLCYYLITLLSVGMLSALMLVFFHNALMLIGLKNGYRWLLTYALAIGTPVLTYSVVFNNHTVCASLLFISFYFILNSKFSEQHAKRNCFIAGFFISLAMTISHPTGGIFLTTFFLYLLCTNTIRHSAILYIIGSLFPIVLYAILNISITGDIKPVNAHPEFYNYPGSFFNGNSFERTLSGAFYHKNLISFLRYSFDCLFGKRGLFLYTPLLFFFCSRDD